MASPHLSRSLKIQSPKDTKKSPKGTDRRVELGFAVQETEKKTHRGGVLVGRSPCSFEEVVAWHSPMETTSEPLTPAQTPNSVCIKSHGKTITTRQYMQQFVGHSIMGGYRP